MENNKLRSYRHEWKYVCTERECILLENRIKQICIIDPNSVNENGYNVASLYFDNYSRDAFWENEIGAVYREKFRIRIYNGDISYAKLELKGKNNLMTYKQQCGITEEEIVRLSKEGTDILLDSELKYKFKIKLDTELLKPRVIVDYDRRAYIYHLGNVRITFDKNITAMKKFREFGRKPLRGQPVLESGLCIFEVKWDNFLPDILYNALNLNSLQQTSFSKFYLCCSAIK